MLNELVAKNDCLDTLRHIGTSAMCVGVHFTLERPILSDLTFHPFEAGLRRSPPIGAASRDLSSAGCAPGRSDAANDRGLWPVVARHGGLDLLLLDELGYIQLDTSGAELFLHILTQRREVLGPHRRPIHHVRDQHRREPHQVLPATHDAEVQTRRKAALVGPDVVNSPGSSFGAPLVVVPRAAIDEHLEKCTQQGISPTFQKNTLLDHRGRRSV